MISPPSEPTSDECVSNAKVWEDEHEIGYACWYPQMGGYVGKCVVVFSKLHGDETSPPCFTAWVWHNGEFPFSNDHSFDDPGKEPNRLHHCSSEQFNRFGDLVARLQGEETYESCEAKAVSWMQRAQELRKTES